MVHMADFDWTTFDGVEKTYRLRPKNAMSPYLTPYKGFLIFLKIEKFIFLKNLDFLQVTLRWSYNFNQLTEVVIRRLNPISSKKLVVEKLMRSL